MTRTRGTLAPLFFLIGIFAIQLNGFLVKQDNQYVLETDYVQVSYNTVDNSITKLSADFLGGKDFSNNLLASPINLEIQDQLNAVNDKISSKLVDAIPELNGQRLTVRSVTSNVEQKLEVNVDPNSRAVHVSISGKVLETIDVVSLSYGVYVKQPSLTGFYSGGVVQMMGKSHACLGSNETLERVYFLGGGGALDVVFDTKGSYETVLISSTDSNYAYRSGVQYVLFGEYPSKSKDMNVAWSNQCWSSGSKFNHTNTVKVPKDTEYSFSLDLYPNNYDFPVYLLNDVTGTKNNLPFTDLRTSLTGIYGSAVGCLQSYYNKQKGIIAPTISHPDVGYSPDTNFFDPDNFITLSSMLYSGDNYLIQQVANVLERTAETMCGIGSDTVASYCNQQRQRTKHSKMIQFPHFTETLSGKKRLFSSARTAQLTEILYEPSSRAGQLMHHFVNLIPTYESIAGSEQLGPNIFWTLTVLKYISLTQDYDFAVKMFPFVDLSCKFVLSFIDNEVYMINAPGPLWIDVLIREQYTSDSNSMIIAFIDEISQFYLYLDNHSNEKQFTSFLNELSSTRSKIIEAFNKYLWISNIPSSGSNAVNDTNDHFVTQLNTDFTTYRDFIDYDSNLMAVAFNLVTDADQVSRIIQRVDAGPYTHVRATWCSEIAYTGDADDCYIVGGSVCGDSVVTLARIGYIDAIARKEINDWNTYNNLLLVPLQNDLIKDVWLYERYDSHGQQIRTSYYFEYPSLVAIMVREISYGIETKLNEIVIHPFTATSFDYRVGNNIEVHFNSENDDVMIQNHQLLANKNDDVIVSKTVSIHGLTKNNSFNLKTSNCGSVDSTVQSNDQGVATFSVHFYDNCQIHVTKA